MQVTIPRAEQVRYKSNGDPAIKITFPFSYDTLAQVKTLPGRKFHGDAKPKYWSCPLSVEAVESLKEWGFELDDALQEFLDGAKIDINEQDTDIEIPGLKMELRDYQKQGVAFMEKRNGRVLLADAPGIGKTAQALAWLQLHPEKRPAVVVCPASVKLNWRKESHMWMGNPKVQVLSGTKTNAALTGDILIINYDILHHWVDWLREIAPQVLVMDEIHYTKNPRAARSKAIKRLAKGVPHVLGLSGTPIVNRPIEAFNALQLIDKTVAPDWWSYTEKFCARHFDGFGWNVKGASNTDALFSLLTGTVMLRRRKEDVLTELPPKQYSTIPFEIDNRKEYERASADFIEWLRHSKSDKAAARASNAETLSRINGLRQLAAQGKLKSACGWIEDFVDQGNKLVVFGYHKAVINAVMERFGERAVKLGGSVTQAQRQEVVDRFQNDESIRVFVGNIRAAGEGITLTAASDVAFLELPWTPSATIQCEDRCHRVTQKDTVNVYYLLSENTIEQDMAELIDAKRAVLDQVLDGGEQEETTMIADLMEQYREREAA